MELLEYEHRIGKSRHIEVKIQCEQCGEEKWVRWTKVKGGQGRFCSLKCANLAQQKWGKEYAYFYLDKLKGRYIARWRDEVTGQTKVMHRSKFLWEQRYGKVPDGYDIHHIDRDMTNDNLDNLELVDGHLHKQGLHGSIREVRNGIVYKQCFRCKNMLPERDFNGQSYCPACRSEYMKEYKNENFG